MSVKAMTVEEFNERADLIESRLEGVTLGCADFLRTHRTGLREVEARKELNEFGKEPLRKARADWADEEEIRIFKKCEADKQAMNDLFARALESEQPDPNVALLSRVADTLEGIDTWETIKFVLDRETDPGVFLNTATRMIDAAREGGDVGMLRVLAKKLPWYCAGRGFAAVAQDGGTLGTNLAARAEEARAQFDPPLVQAVRARKATLERGMRNLARTREIVVRELKHAERAIVLLEFGDGRLRVDG